MRPDFSGNHAPNWTVTFRGAAAPSWPAARDLLAGRGVLLNMRMIDGQPAFPDEEPPEDWREIRVAAADGMATVRREGDRLVFVTWGNASRALIQTVNALAWAFVETGGGQVETAEGPIGASQFLRIADLPDAIRVGNG